MNKSVLFNNQDYNEPSVSKPENLLRETRRQKSITECEIPKICMLDTDVNLVTYLKKKREHRQTNAGPGIIQRCTSLISRFAVLLAEQMFVSGCELLVSITSAETISPPSGRKRFVLIKEALRTEDISYHYLPPEEPALLDRYLLKQLFPLKSDPENSLTNAIRYQLCK